MFRFLQLAIGLHIIAETAMHRRIVDIATLSIASHYLIVGRIEHHRTLLLEQVYAKALILIVEMHQPQERRHHVYLHAQSNILLLWNARTKDDERYVII